MKKSKITNQLMIKPKIAKLQKFSSSTIMLAVAIIMLVIGFLAIGITVYFKVVINFAGEDCHFKFDNIFLNVLYSIGALAFLYFIYRKILPKINEKILITLSIIFSLSLGLLWVNYVKLKPISDQSMVIYCAECLLDNNLSNILKPGEYLNRNPHQLGFVTYIMAIFQLFNTRDPIILQKLNVIYSTINTVLLYLICKQLFKQDLIRKLSLLLITFFSIYWIFLNTHVYGNIPGLMFALVATLFTLKYLEENKLYKIIIIALSLTMAYLLKSNYEIFLLAIAIILLLHSIQSKRFSPIIGIITIFTIVFGSKLILYTITEKQTGYSLNTGVDMLAYVYMGISEPATLAPGWYNSEVEIIYKNSEFIKSNSRIIAKRLLAERLEYLLKNLDYTFKYFSSKLQTTWLNPTFQVIWCSTPSIVLDADPEYNHYVAFQQLMISILTGKAYQLEQIILDIYQIITFIFAGVGLCFSLKKGSLKKTLLPLIFLGGFIFHIIWETKSVYVIQYFYIMLPFAALGLYKLFNKLDQLCNNITQEPEKTTGAKILEFKRKEQ